MCCRMGFRCWMLLLRRRACWSLPGFVGMASPWGPLLGGLWLSGSLTGSLLLIFLRFGCRGFLMGRCRGLGVCCDFFLLSADGWRGFFAGVRDLTLRWHPRIVSLLQASPLCGAAPTF